MTNASVPAPWPETVPDERRQIRELMGHPRQDVAPSRPSDAPKDEIENPSALAALPERSVVELLRELAAVDIDGKLEKLLANAADVDELRTELRQVSARLRRLEQALLGPVD